jgi:hypothetical protein
MVGEIIPEYRATSVGISTLRNDRAKITPAKNTGLSARAHGAT